MPLPDFRLRQLGPAESGLVCLAACLTLAGSRIDIEALRRTFPVSKRGLEPPDIIDLAGWVGARARLEAIDLADLWSRPGEKILLWRRNGYAVVRRNANGAIRLFDPGVGWRRISAEDLAQGYRGQAILVDVDPTHQPEILAEAAAVPLLIFPAGLKRRFAQTVLLSLLAQGVVLATPLYMQQTVDRAIARADLDLLTLLALAFAGLNLFGVVIGALRSLTIQQISALLGVGMTGAVVRHLLRLPLAWFQQHRLSDVMTRAQGVDQLRGFFSTALVGGLLDGVLSIVTLALMLALAPWLALVAALGMAAYVGLRLATIPISLDYAARNLIAGIDEQGKRLETVRAIQTIKSMGAEAERERDWSDRFDHLIAATLASGRVSVALNALQSTLSALTTVLVVYLGARAVIGGEMSVGMLLIFVAYQGQFTGRAANLFDQVVAWAMLGLPRSRLRGILHTPPEGSLDRPDLDPASVTGALEVRDVSFRYAWHDDWVLRRRSLSIRAGEFVVVTGPSGCGKSTLVKLICGLYAPDEGAVLLDGHDLRDWSPRSVRRAMGVVMQDDEILAGTIAENIAFFAARIDEDRVRRCLELAALDDSIAALPSGIHTAIGDLGAQFSGGQRQRLLLARAFYAEARLLILDESTSNLDVQTERRVLDALRTMKITRILVSHRPETIAAADRVIRLETERGGPVRAAG